MYRLAKWDITSKCNLKCKHCYNSQRYGDENKNPNYISNQQVFKVIESLKKLGFTKIHFLGGEPLFSPNIITAISYARFNNIEVSLTTNGMLLSDGMIITLLKNDIYSILISLDGITDVDNDKIRGNGVFINVIKNIKNIVRMKKETRSNLKICITLTLNKCNISSADRILEFAEDLGVDAVLLSYLDKEGAATDNWNEIGINLKEVVDALEAVASTKKFYPNLTLEIDCKKNLSEYLFKKYGIENVYMNIEKSFCNGGDDEFYIQADGLMFPCRQVSTSLADDAIKSGKYEHKNIPNLLKDSPSDIINSKYLFDFYNYSRDASIYEGNKTCLKCKYKDDCKPCPLKCHSTSIVEECEYAQYLLKKLDSDLLKSIIIPNNNRKSTLVSGSIEFLKFDTQDKIVLDDLGMEFWNAIENNRSKKLIDIINELYINCYTDVIDKDIFINDALEFIYNMINKQLIVSQTIQ